MSKTAFWSLAFRDKLGVRLGARLGLLAILALLSPPACSKKSDPEVKTEAGAAIHLELCVYRMPRQLAVSEVFNRPKNTDYSDVLKHVQELAADKKSTLVASSSILTLSGQKCITESVREHRYPSEFDPPQIPQTFGGNTSSEKKVTKTVTTTVTEESDSSFPKTPSTTPTNFTTRNCGFTVEFEPTFDAKTDTVNFAVAVQFVDFLGNVKYAADGGSFVEQPIFHSRKLQTNGFLKNGGTTLLGSFEPDRPAKDEDFTDVVFIHAATW